MSPDDVTGWDLLFPRHPLHSAAWLLIGIMLGWLIRSWLAGRRR